MRDGGEGRGGICLSVMPCFMGQSCLRRRGTIWFCHSLVSGRLTVVRWAYTGPPQRLIGVIEHAWAYVSDSGGSAGGLSPSSDLCSKCV